MRRMTPLTGEGKPLDVAARWAELTGFVEAAARDGWPAHERERSLWHPRLRLGHDLQAASFALVGDGDCGETLTLTDGRVVKRLPDPPAGRIGRSSELLRWRGRSPARGKASGSRRRRWMPGWGCRRIRVRICCGTGIRRWW